MKTATGIQSERGFSLIELMVAVALFAIIMMIAVGALMAMVNANRKAHALESVMNNLNVTLDSMVRSTRMGTAYYCNSADIPDTSTNEGDCQNGATTFSFAPFGSNTAVQEERWVYTFSGGRLYRSKEGGPNAVAITAPEVTIDSMAFYVIGTERRDVNQPKVVIVVKGTAAANASAETSFYVQSTAVQRTLDI